MSWSAPRTWVTGEVLSSTNLNTHVRDQFTYLGGADSVSATPPGSPQSGQRWTLPVDAANGIYWEFRYNSATARWVFTGGLPFAVYDNGPATVVSASLSAIGSLGTLSLPRAGTYRVYWGWSDWTSTYIAAGAGQLQRNGVAVASYGNIAPNSHGLQYDHKDVVEIPNCVAGDILRLVHASDGSATHTYYRRFIEVLPRNIS